MVIAGLGLLGGQTYWLVNRYEVEKEKLVETISQPVINALFEKSKQGQKTDSLMRPVDAFPEIESFRQKVDSVLPPSFLPTDSTSGDGKPKPSWYFKLLQGGNRVDLPDSLQKEIEALPEYQEMRELFALQVARLLNSLDDKEYDLSRFRKLLDEELKEVDLELTYRLALWEDSALIKSSPPGLSPEALGKADLSRFWNTFSTGQDGPELRFYLLRPGSVILLRMGGTLVFSLLLIALIFGCLIYMLRIIFRQKRLSEVKNDFINNMTHELKTPIASVSAAIEALLHFGGLEDPEKTQRYLRLSQKELGRLEGMVEKVLDIAAFERESYQLKRESVDVKALLSELSQRYNGLSHKQVEASFRNEMVSPILSADKFHLNQMLTNLLDNAVKYGDEPVRIRIHARDEGEHLTIRISDNGPGIAPAHQKMIFEKFYRIPTGDLHPVKGFGLGLSYVKNMMSLHGGEVWLESRLGKGTDFYLKFPRKHEED
jgi:signal transduction histidine kinase